MADYIPEGIIIKILERLPPKALLRFTCICKSWYSLITSPQFISTHFNSALNMRNNAPLLLLRRCTENVESYALYLDNESFTCVAKIDSPFKSMNSYFTVIGNCNGLLCISDDRVYYMHTVILWNPCIKKHVVLPKPKLSFNSCGTFMQALGFGFDPVSNDYKVIRITYVDCYVQVEVYRLSTGSWQDISFLGLQHVVYKRCRQAYFCGSIHWIASCSDGYDLIVMFDTSDEVFREIRLPDTIGCIGSKDLVTCMDSLGVIVSTVSGAEPCFSVWVMKENGVVQSWSKCFTVGYPSSCRKYVRPLWLRQCGEAIAVREDGRLVCYDRFGVEVKDLGLDGSEAEEYQRSLHVDSYVQSLVLLDWVAKPVI